MLLLRLIARAANFRPQQTESPQIVFFILLNELQIVFAEDSAREGLPGDRVKGDM